MAVAYWLSSVGDALDALMAFMVMRTCQQIEGGLPADVKAKMYFNIILDFGVGLVPILGDVADALFRANTRNAVVLEKYLREKGAKALKAQGNTQPRIDPSDPAEFDRQLMEENGPPPPYTGPATRQDTQGQTQNQTSIPTAQNQAPKENSGGWFSGFRSKKRQPDVEQGNNMDSREQSGPPLPVRSNDPPARTQSTLQKNRR